MRGWVWPMSSLCDNNLYLSPTLLLLATVWYSKGNLSTSWISLPLSRVTGLLDESTTLIMVCHALMMQQHWTNAAATPHCTWGGLCSVNRGQLRVLHNPSFSVMECLISRLFGLITRRWLLRIQSPFQHSSNPTRATRFPLYGAIYTRHRLVHQH